MSTISEGYPKNLILWTFLNNEFVLTISLRRATGGRKEEKNFSQRQFAGLNQEKIVNLVKYENFSMINF